jgi:MFS family permease
LRSERTGEIILVPTPSKDPNDPLVYKCPVTHLLSF